MNPPGPPPVSAGKGAEAAGMGSQSRYAAVCDGMEVGKGGCSRNEIKRVERIG